MSPRDLLERAYDLVAADEIDAALDVIYQEIDGMMCAGKRDEIDAVLRSSDVARLDGSVMLGFLAITLPYANRLNDRFAYFGRVKTRLESMHSPDEVAAMLHGLER